MNPLPFGIAETAAETLTDADETAAKGLLGGAGAMVADDAAAAPMDRWSTNVTGVGHSHLARKNEALRVKRPHMVITTIRNIIFYIGRCVRDPQTTQIADGYA